MSLVYGRVSFAWEERLSLDRFFAPERGVAARYPKHVLYTLPCKFQRDGQISCFRHSGGMGTRVLEDQNVVGAYIALRMIDAFGKISLIRARIARVG